MLRPQTSGGDTYCVPYVCVSMSVSVSVIVCVKQIVQVLPIVVA